MEDEMTKKDLLDIKKTRAKKIEILKNYIFFNDNIKFLKNELDDITSKLYGIKEKKLYTDNINSSNFSDLYRESLIDKKDECIKFMCNQINSYNDEKLKIECAIYGLKNEKQKFILIQKYLYGLTYFEISNSLSLSERQVQRIHNNAIDNIDLSELS